MPRSAPSSTPHTDEQELYPASNEQWPSTTPSSPTVDRRSLRSYPIHMPNMPEEASERTPLLINTDGPQRTSAYLRSTPATPRRNLSRQHSVTGSIRLSKNHSRASSGRFRLASTPTFDRSKSNGLLSSRTMSSMFGSYQDDRVWYDQFTSTDWVHDSIADGFRVRELQKRKDLRGRLWLWFDASQGWILVFVIGCFTALIAYLVDVTEASIFDYKEGFCTSSLLVNRNKCCHGFHTCGDWQTWSQIIRPSGTESKWIDFAAFNVGCIVLATLSCYLTLFSKTTVPSSTSLLTLDEDLGAVRHAAQDDKDSDTSPGRRPLNAPINPAMTYYSAAGSGVAEVKVILSGFVLHGYLGVRTLFLKTLGLILSVASGLSLGKEGPYVHIATCVGNIACRMFSKYNLNDGKRREVLSAAAAAGVGVAFGSPIGGVLFSLEEVSYYFPPKTLFRTFFCSVSAALCLKFLNPYGTGKIVLFEVRYLTDWRLFELFAFVLLGIAGGSLGALFIKASRFWAVTFRRIPAIKKYPMLEVMLVALTTGLVSFWNRYTRLPVAELLFELASPCTSTANTGLCRSEEEIPEVIRYLIVAFLIKAFLTTITFGLKVPAGIYVPSMVVGGLLGRIVGHITQYIVLRYPDAALFANCPPTGGIEACVTPGVYALVAAGATMCGVTRLSVTLAVILFELTGSLDHVLPFSLAVLCAKWTADMIEPLSIYDLLTEMNSYPFLDNKTHPVFDTELGDMVTRVRRDHIIDISASPLIRAVELREKLEKLQMAGEIDGGLPLLRDKILVGLIPAPDLEFALDRLDNEQTAVCLMVTEGRWHGIEEDEEDVLDPNDLTPFIDPSPVALDVHSPMDLVYQCFVKLGLRYICVLKEGHFAGMVHKKSFVKYIRELQEEQGKHE